VIVAVRNDPEGIRRTLEVLREQTIDAASFEVVVVDDGSTDATAAVVEAHPRGDLVVGQGKGAYAARNRGLAHARGAIIAITDAGCEPSPSWLERALSRLRHEGEDTVLAGQISMPLQADASLASMVDVMHHLDQRRIVYEERYAVTANLIAPRDVFDRVGPFDATLLRGGDREWTQRAIAHGYRLVYAEEVVIVHPPRATARELIDKSMGVGRAASAMRRRHPDAKVVRPYLRRDLLLPRHWHDGRLRVRWNGAAPSRRRWLGVAAAQVAFVNLPQALGAAIADARAWCDSRRSSSPPG
jgi:glycosyltransferase involved in cell wall biosynthesis